jgi:hypothetical protein
MLRKLLSVLLPRDEAEARARAYREAIREEAKIGGSLFGPVPEGSRREFFCLDEHTWVWHEEWTDANGLRQTRTTRYDVRPQGILKAQDGQPYQRLSSQEASHLLQAAARYNQLIDVQLAPYLTATA